MPKTSAVARSGSAPGISPDAMPRCDHRPHRRHRRRRVGGELAELPVLHEEQEAEELGFSSCAWQKPRIIAATLPRAVGLGVRQRLQPRGELDVVALEGLPDQLLLADEVAVERAFRDIDRAGDVAHGGLGDALLDEELRWRRVRCGRGCR